MKKNSFKSAVDVHVGKYLMKECFLKYLKGKTILLITHALYYLKYVDYVFVMEDGQANLHGTYNNLKQIPQFNNLLNRIKKHYSENGQDEILIKEPLSDQDHSEKTLDSSIFEEKSFDC